MAIAIAQTVLEMLWSSSQLYFYRWGIFQCFFNGTQIPCQTNQIVIGIVERPAWYSRFFRYIDTLITNEMNWLTRLSGVKGSFILGGVIPSWTVQPEIVFASLAVIGVCTVLLYRRNGNLKAFLRALQYMDLAALPLPIFMYIFDPSAFWPDSLSTILHGLLTLPFLQFMQTYVCNALMLVIGVPVLLLLYWLERREWPSVIKKAAGNRLVIVGSLIVLILALGLYTNVIDAGYGTTSGTATGVVIWNGAPTGGIFPCASVHCTESGEPVQWAFHVINGTATTGYAQTG